MKKGCRPVNESSRMGIQLKMFSPVNIRITDQMLTKSHVLNDCSTCVCVRTWDRVTWHLVWLLIGHASCNWAVNQTRTAEELPCKYASFWFSAWCHCRFLHQPISIILISLLLLQCSALAHRTRSTNDTAYIHMPGTCIHSRTAGLLGQGRQELKSDSNSYLYPKFNENSSRHFWLSFMQKVVM